MTNLSFRKLFSVVVATHAVMSDKKEVFGPAHCLVKFIMRHCYGYLFIRFDLQHRGVHPLIETNQEIGSLIRVPSVFSRLSYMGDMISVFFVTIKFGKVDLFVGIDPINALTGLLLRFFRRVKLVVYYSVDYSPNRFGMSALDLVYRVFDSICAKQADEVWNVSRRIYELRIRQNLDRLKNVYMPNSPEFGSFRIYSSSEIKKHRMVLVSNLTESVAFELIVDAMKQVKNKVLDSELHVIGNGPGYLHFLNLVERNDLKDTIFFLGHMEHNELERKLGKYAVGLAIYSSKDSWNNYRDSMKVREYLAAGVPVILDSAPSTSEDVRNADAGEVISLNTVALVSSMVRILTRSSIWERYRQNAINLAREFDKDAMLDEAFKRLLTHFYGNV